MTGILTLKKGGKRSARMAGVKSKREKYSTSNRDTAKQPTVKKTKTNSIILRTITDPIKFSTQLRLFIYQPPPYKR